jgi:hypothetical protein
VTSTTPGTYTDGTNTLVLTKVQLVLGEIEVQHSEAACAKNDVELGVNTDVAGTETETEVQAEVDECPDVKVGPVLLDVPVATLGAQQTFTASLPVGTYDEFEFKIRKASNATEQAFISANPTFDGVSIHVEGTWNGSTPVAFNSALSAKQELKLSQPITVAENQTANLTLFVDVSQWFASTTGTLLDPNTGNSGQPNEAVITNNIKASFHAFEDDNHDGEDDHSHTS